MEITRLNALIEELEEALPDPDEGLELKPEVEDRLLRSSNLPRDFFLSAEGIHKKMNL